MREDAKPSSNSIYLSKYDFSSLVSKDLVRLESVFSIHREVEMLRCEKFTQQGTGDAGSSPEKEEGHSPRHTREKLRNWGSRVWRKVWDIWLQEHGMRNRTTGEDEGLEMNVIKERKARRSFPRGAESDFRWEKARKATNGDFQWQHKYWCAECHRNQRTDGVIGSGNTQRKREKTTPF